MEQEFLTVGQLARKVGTTVRTIQYYDQQGLLSPSAKGPGNQRLYSPEDENDLYRILTLKYLGLSLAEIKERKDLVDSPQEVGDILAQTMESLEEDFQALVERLSVLKRLLGLTSSSDEVNWSALASAIEGDKDEGGYFWHQMTGFDEPEPEAARDEKASKARGIAVAKWHDLIADAISLMSDRVPPNDERAADLARRYAEIMRTEGGSLHQAFILAENVTPHRGASGSFDVLRDSVVKYLDAAMEALPETGQGGAR